MVAIAKRKIANTAELVDFFDKKGGLHDCVVNLLQWQPSSKSIEINLLDVNANFLGLPEYDGLTPCVIRFMRVGDMNLSIPASIDKLRIYEVEISFTGVHPSLKVQFYPSGSLDLSFNEVELLELAL